MILYHAFVPHTPLLVPAIGKEHLHKVRGTTNGLETIARDLESLHIDTLVFFSAHTVQFSDAFSINLSPTYHIDLSEFGDLSASKNYEPNLALTDSIQREMRRNGIPITLNSTPGLTYGCGVPLHLLTQKISPRIVPISYSGRTPKQHVEFGRALKDILTRTDARVAVIAAGDLAHTLSTNAPEGLKQEGQMFDKKALEAVSHASVSKLLSLPKRVVEESAQCGYEPMLMLMGLMQRSNVRPDILCYEAPFGVGYLTARFRHV